MATLDKNGLLARFLQTASATTWMITMATGDLLGYLATAYILFYTEILRYFMLLYFIFMYYDWNTYKQGGRSSKWTYWLRNTTWYRYIADYYSAKLVKTVELDQNKTYMLCCFPHGILGMGIFCSFGTDFCNYRKKFPGLEFRTAILDQHFKSPLFREYVYWNGCFGCGSDSMNYQLSKEPQPPATGKAVLVFIGGVAESYECLPGTYRLLVKKRKGFVKIALKHGVPMVPVFTFGETSVYDQFYGPKGSRLRRIQNYIQNLIGIAPLLLKGRGIFQRYFGLIPHPVHLTTVVGAPIETPKSPEPTQEQIDKYHEIFVDKLVELFETHKHKYIENADSVHIEFL